MIHLQIKVQEKFCHMREVWVKLISEARKLYNLGPYGTIDEKLLKFRGRFSFRQYMPTKPGRYRIKFSQMIKIITATILCHI